MLLEGSWRLCDDGAVRPVIVIGVRGADGSYVSTFFLVDTGADCTVLSHDTLRTSSLSHSPLAVGLEGVGGSARSAEVGTSLRFVKSDGTFAEVNSNFAACLDSAALDMSVLGRDILTNFAVIVDRAAERVVLVGKGHTYTITGP